MPKAVLCSQAAADVVATRADRQSFAGVSLDHLLSTARINLHLVEHADLADQRQRLVHAAAWLILAIEGLDRTAAGTAQGGAA